MLDAHGSDDPMDRLEPVSNATDIMAMSAVVKEVHVAPSVKAYIIDLATATRDHPSLSLGMSPRAALALQRASRARAAAAGRDFVLPDDVKALAGPVLEHRLILTPEAALGGVTPTDALSDVLAAVPVPTGRGVSPAQS
jgi:MoxR-like ATPase